MWPAWGIGKYTQVLIGRSERRYGRPGSRREHAVKTKTVSYTYHEEGGRIFSLNCGTVKPTYKGTARD
jgi:hypothetical protein